MSKGTIVSFNSSMGFGKLRTENQQELLFNQHDLERGVNQLAPGTCVEFEQKGKQATHIRVLQNAQVAQAVPMQGMNIVEKPPYRFVAIDPEQAAITDTPVFHNGANPDQQELISGELRCEFTALTPLLVANEQYDQGGKKVLEPLRLPDPDGRVLIPGEGLKGMIRHSLGALLSAPMERVGERSYSYRPNLNFANPNQARFVYRPAVIKKINSNGTIEVGILNGLNGWDGVVFVDEIAYSSLCKALGVSQINPGTLISKVTAGVKIDSQNRFNSIVKKLRRGNNTDSLLQDFILCKYSFGIDGHGLLADIFGKNGNYKAVLVTPDNLKSCTIDQKVVSHYKKTLQHLADKKYGHISNRHSLSTKPEFDSEQISQAIKNLENNLIENQLIYLEIENTNQKIHSFGHHFRYRWRYADTVRTRWINESTEQIRKILSPIAVEQYALNPGDESAPKELSGARLFFGYVGNDDEESSVKCIGKGDNFKRFAGRLSFNMALEQIADENTEERFLNHDRDCIVPLKILGMPRPSAVEYYLQQDQSKIRSREDNGGLLTYGDLPGDDPAGELQGRKFYLHQPAAADQSGCYQTDKPDIIESDQAALARFVLKPDTQFRFTLRFHDLRPWELGALLMTIDPEKSCQLAENNLPKKIKDYLKGRKPFVSNRTPLFAHKLGHGRPLGLGSIKLTVHELWRWQSSNLSDIPDDFVQDQGTLEKSAIEKFIHLYFAKIQREKIFLQWLEVHRYAGRSRAEYPADNQGNIYGWHTKIRGTHAQKRRLRAQSNHFIEQEALVEDGD